MTPIELADLRERFDTHADPQAARLVQHADQLREFLVYLVDHLDSQPGPAKVAEYYQMADRARHLRAACNPTP